MQCSSSLKEGMPLYSRLNFEERAWAAKPGFSAIFEQPSVDGGSTDVAQLIDLAKQIQWQASRTMSSDMAGSLGWLKKLAATGH